MNGTPYYYVVSGLNNSIAAGGPNSTEVSATPQATLATPTGLTATVLSESQVRLNWTNNAPRAAAFVVERALHGGANWTLLSAAVAPGAGTYTDSSASASTNYDYRLQCTGTAPASDYATVTIATPAGIGDGIPGAWRFQYFGNGLTATGSSAANADPDRDGVPNGLEYLAGTNPTDSESVFRIRELARSGSNFAVSFRSVVGKTYLVEKTGSLGPSATWNPVQSNIAGTGGVITITDPGAAGTPRGFYRVRLP